MPTPKSTQPAFHEDLRRPVPAAAASNRSFGLVMAAAGGAVALLPLRSGGAIRLWAAIPAVGFFLSALFRPSLLERLNRCWTLFALLLARLVHPIAVGLLFFGLFTPIGFLMRRLGSDPMRRRLDPGATTYWIPRAPPGPEPATMRKQF